jgi:hypothetical protein
LPNPGAPDLLAELAALLGPGKPASLKKSININTIFQLPNTLSQHPPFFYLDNKSHVPSLQIPQLEPN